MRYLALISKVWVSNITLVQMPQDLIDKSTLVQVMACCSQAASHSWISVDQDLWSQMPSLGHNELNQHNEYCRHMITCILWSKMPNNNGLVLLRFCTHKRHPISHVHGWAMGHFYQLFRAKWLQDMDGLVQERRNSIANALDLCFSCTNLEIWRVDFTTIRYQYW